MIPITGEKMTTGEDFATAKYFTLRQLDIPDEKMRLIYVKSLKLKQPHMVLGYYAEATADPLILDNLVKEILSASERFFPQKHPLQKHTIDYHGIDSCQLPHIQACA